MEPMHMVLPRLITDGICELICDGILHSPMVYVYQHIPSVSNLFHRICSNEELTFKINSAQNYKNVVLKSAAFISVAHKSFQALLLVTNPPLVDWPKFQHTALSEGNQARQIHDVILFYIDVPVYSDYLRYS